MLGSSLLAAAVAAPLCARPTWITEVSATAKTAYDTNVFGTDNERATQAIADREAWVTSLGVRVAAKAGACTFAYAPTHTRYAGESTETHTQHRLTLAAAGRDGAWSWSLDQTLAVIDGPDESVRYAGLHSFGMALARERRAQAQGAAQASLRYDTDHAFVRTVASATIVDLQAESRAPLGADAGWLNWVDRRDFSSGADFGWKVSPDTTLLTGFRLGYQHHGQTAWTAAHSSNHYSRALVGFETRVAKRLTASLLAGPDFRRYSAAGLCLADRTPRTWYLEAAATATLDDANALTFASKQERALTSTGQSAYDVASLALTWKHRLAPTLSLLVTGQYQEADYPAPLLRRDTLGTATAALHWAPDSRLALTAELVGQDGRDDLGTAATVGRTYERRVASLGARYVF